MTTIGKNFSGQTIPPSPFDVETHFIRCNFSHSEAIDAGGGIMIGNRLWPGDNTPRTFDHCNLRNCEPPPSSTLISCNTSISTILRESEEIEIDGESFVEETSYPETYGRLNPDTLTYEYRPSPRRESEI